MVQSFIYKDKVRIYDTDAQGIVHYAGYYRFFTDATESFMRDTLDISYPLLSDTIWFVVVESEARYYKSAKLGDELSVMLKPELVSSKALRFNFEIYSKGTKICEGHITQVSINRKRWKATEMPMQIREKISTISKPKASKPKPKAK